MVVVLLLQPGTTGDPKVVMLSHDNVRIATYSCCITVTSSCTRVTNHLSGFGCSLMRFILEDVPLSLSPSSPGLPRLWCSPTRPWSLDQSTLWPTFLSAILLLRSLHAQYTTGRPYCSTLWGSRLFGITNTQLT